MKLWDAYRETYSYANDIEFTDTVEAIKWIYRNIYLVGLTDVLNFVN